MKAAGHNATQRSYSGFGAWYEAVLTADAVGPLLDPSVGGRVPALNEEFPVAIVGDEILWLKNADGQLVLASHSTPIWQWAAVFGSRWQRFAEAGAKAVTGTLPTLFADQVATAFVVDASSFDGSAHGVQPVKAGDDRSGPVLHQALVCSAFEYGQARGLLRQRYAGPERRNAPRG